jgi:hypothetical protein
MTHTQILLTIALVVGFALLLATVGLFAINRGAVGLVSLVLAGACFVAALVLTARMSEEWQAHVRAEVLAKYDVSVQEWGAPLGSAPTWMVDGKHTECVVDAADKDDPVVRCDDQELPKG